MYILYVIYNMPEEKFEWELKYEPFLSLIWILICILILRLKCTFPQQPNKYILLNITYTYVKYDSLFKNYI